MWCTENLPHTSSIKSSSLHLNPPNERWKVFNAYDNVLFLYTHACNTVHLQYYATWPRRRHIFCCVLACRHVFIVVVAELMLIKRKEITAWWPKKSANMMACFKYGPATGPQLEKPVGQVATLVEIGYTKPTLAMLFRKLRWEPRQFQLKNQ